MNKQAIPQLATALANLDIAIRDVMADPEKRNQVNQVLKDKNYPSLEKFRESLAFLWEDSFQDLIRESHK